MFSNILKVIELLLKHLANTPEKKRGEFAKELAAVYVAILEVIARGRRILELRPDLSGGSTREEIVLLSEQVGAVQALREALTEGKLALVMKIHMSEPAEQLRFMMELKGQRVRFHLDQLVTDGKLLKPEEWVDGMEERFGMSLKEAKRVLKARGKKMVEIGGSAEDIAQASRILDDLAAAAEKIRLYLASEIKLEELL